MQGLHEPDRVHQVGKHDISPMGQTLKAVAELNDPHIIRILGCKYCHPVTDGDAQPAFKVFHEPLRRPGDIRRRIALIKLGSPKLQAILTGLSRKGYWHLAKTYATNCGLSKEYLQSQGLVSLRTLWIGIHYPATAR
ncbi:MAG: hypothetical protein A4E57_00157 [Syntrophorhabdaceae bacterium PtaU1.Bin034]|nr:MAG: hypothetical protein A4E57_00157 [Syntrophorhabdaceae bacterium PtaU1.Bin034]